MQSHLSTKNNHHTRDIENIYNNYEIISYSNSYYHFLIDAFITPTSSIVITAMIVTATIIIPITYTIVSLNIVAMTTANSKDDHMD